MDWVSSYIERLLSLRLYIASAELLEWLPFLLVACLDRRFGGALFVSASLSLSRIRYRRD
jgi:hypothetical protein